MEHVDYSAWEAWIIIQLFFFSWGGGGGGGGGGGLIVLRGHPTLNMPFTTRYISFLSLLFG